MHTITLKTNYNNKLCCNAFLHIAAAPAQGIPESKMNQEYLIKTEDNSHPPKTFKLIDLLRFPLGKIYSIYTLPSHGIDSLKFYEIYLRENPSATPETKLAVYYYQIPGDG